MNILRALTRLCIVALPTLNVLVGHADEPKISPQAKNEAGDPWKEAVEVESEHFLLRTDIPKEEAAKVSRQMELLYRFIHKTFPDLQPAPMKLVCWIFRHQKEYDAVMKKVHPDTVGKGGFFHYNDHMTHFFKHHPESDVWKTILKTDPEADIDEYTRSVWLHETTHQILHECVQRGKETEKDPTNFWIREGIATYFETLVLKEDGSYELGSVNHYRYRNIKKYLLKRAGDLDLTHLVTAPRSQVFGEKKTSQLNYHMSIILSDFLFKHGGGKYREKFLKYVVAVHQGKNDRDLFKNIVGVAPGDLKPEWQEYLRTTFK